MEFNRIYWKNGETPDGWVKRGNTQQTGDPSDYADAIEFKDDGASKRYQFILSTDTKDMAGDIIQQGGWDLSRFSKSAPALWSHRSDLYPVGKWVSVHAEGKRLVGSMVFAPTSRAQEARKLVEGGYLKSVSVGFVPGDYEPNIAKGGGYNFTSGHLLLEASLCNVGCNPDAMLVGIYGKSEEEKTPEQIRMERRLEAFEIKQRIRLDDEKYAAEEARRVARLSMTPEQRHRELLSVIYSGDELEIRMQAWRDRGQS